MKFLLSMILTVGLSTSALASLEVGAEMKDMGVPIDLAIEYPSIYPPDAFAGPQPVFHTDPKETDPSDVFNGNGINWGALKRLFLGAPK